VIKSRFSHQSSESGLAVQDFSQPGSRLYLTVDAAGLRSGESLEHRTSKSGGQEFEYPADLIRKSSP
jgi:hypothetical protein